ncbi:hypothetical protein OH492_12560 [Vibrio chagasii]|nr:hypothetical protein [Vibrio chagasii]
MGLSLGPVEVSIWECFADSGALKIELEADLYQFVTCWSSSLIAM